MKSKKNTLKIKSRTMKKGGSKTIEKSIKNYLNNLNVIIENNSLKKECNKINGLNKRNYCPCYLFDPNKKIFCDLIHQYYKENPQKIPKIIHQIWIGSKKRPDKWLNTFREYAKKNGWEYHLWDEDKISKLKMINQIQYHKEPSYHGKADILRHELLYKYGGIYVDADSALTGNKDLNDVITQCNNLGFFTAKECVNCGNGVASGVLGSTKKNYITEYIIKCISKLCNCKNVMPYQNIGPYMLDQCLEGLNISIYPYYYFYPKYWHEDLLDEDISQYKDSYMFQYGYTTNQLKL